MSESRSAVVVGAGISGLAAAFWLKRWGFHVTVLEREPVPGGTMRTIHDDGWLIESGPNSALETTPLFGEMFAALGIEGEREYANPASNRRFVLRDRVLHPIPMSPGAFLGTRLWSAGGKLRLLKEPFVGRAQREESIAEFVERRLGREILDYAINPFVAGVYAGNPEHLSVRAAFPKLYALEEKYGGLIKGMFLGARERKRRMEKAKDRARMFSFRSGMQAFPDALARHLGTAVFLGRTVTAVRTSGGGFAVLSVVGGREEVHQGDVVILSVPAPHAASILAGFDPALGNGLRDIMYPPVAEVFLGFRNDQILRRLDGFGFLVPAKERRRILGTIWSSAIFSNRAPAGHAALTTFVGGSRQPELLQQDDGDLLTMVLGELSSIMGVRGEPVKVRIVRWDHAIPQYRLGHLDLCRAFDDFESRHPGLFLCSNFRGGIAVGDCLMNSAAIAQRAKDLPAGSTRKERSTA